MLAIVAAGGLSGLIALLELVDRRRHAAALPLAPEGSVSVPAGVTHFVFERPEGTRGVRAQLAGRCEHVTLRLNPLAVGRASRAHGNVPLEVTGPVSGRWYVTTNNRRRSDDVRLVVTLD